MVHRQEPASTRPVRTCVGCRVRAEDAELLRAVLVDGEAIPDPRRREPGRGAWIHPHPGCLAKAEKRRAFTRAFRTSGVVGVDGLRTEIERLVSSIGAGGPRAVSAEKEAGRPVMSQP
ncbi:MAG: YlxR family protein [Actinomycetota bacterium]|nr:YlxR family protein [Actinomycetota bacterium]